MSYQVFLTDEASRDLTDIINFVEQQDSVLRAQQLLNRIESTFKSLAANPQRGSIPNELQALGIKDFRQIFFKPYRLLYRIDKKLVYVILIADGRRNMQSLLEQRLLR
jgi:toxin ParE1/3/4